MSTGSHRRVIAIDGPAAAGKTTVALALAGRVGAIFLDTGLLYRAVTLAAIKQGIDAGDSDALTSLVRSLEIAVRPATVDDGRPVDLLIDGEDVSNQLRLPEVDRSVSEVSAHPAIRAELLPLQRRIADNATVVMVGRDIGSVVVPDAGVKIYLDASITERARRRHDELAARGSTLTLDTVLDDLTQRDEADSSREAAPLQIAPGSTVVATDGLSIAEVVDEIQRIVQQTWSSQDGQPAAGR